MSDDFSIGDMVRFRIAIVGGTCKIAGRILLQKPNGDFEIKSQQHGYFVLAKGEIEAIT